MGHKHRKVKFASGRTVTFRRGRGADTARKKARAGAVVRRLGRDSKGRFRPR